MQKRESGKLLSFSGSEFQLERGSGVMSGSPISERRPAKPVPSTIYMGVDRLFVNILSTDSISFLKLNVSSWQPAIPASCLEKSVFRSMTDGTTEIEEFP